MPSPWSCAAGRKTHLIPESSTFPLPPCPPTSPPFRHPLAHMEPPQASHFHHRSHTTHRSALGATARAENSPASTVTAPPYGARHRAATVATRVAVSQDTTKPCRGSLGRCPPQKTRHSEPTPWSKASTMGGRPPLPQPPPMSPTSASLLPQNGAPGIPPKAPTQADRFGRAHPRLANRGGHQTGTKPTEHRGSGGRGDGSGGSAAPEPMARRCRHPHEANL